MSNKSKIVVIEGLDGCGKSTQFELVTAYLKNKGINVKPISFPDYEQKSSALVKMYLNGELSHDAEGVNAYAASSFYAVDRYASYKQFWENDYQNGAMILAARYVTSNCIYQMEKLDENAWDEYINWLEDYEYDKLGLPRPDVVIFLDMPVEVSQKLLSGRYNGEESKKDIHEADLRFMFRCRETALYSAKKLGWNIINCSEGESPLSRDEITNKITEIIDGMI